MRGFFTFWKWLLLCDVEPEVAIAQLKGTKLHLPFLYVLLALNASAVSITYYQLAPTWLTIGASGLLIGFCLMRVPALFASRTADITCAQDAIREMRAILLVTTAFAITLPIWALTLSGYGGAAEQGTVATFLGITIVGSIFCLIYLPQAATLVGALAATRCVYYYLSMPGLAYTAIALNFALVTIALVSIVLAGFEGFRQMVLAEGKVAEKQRETERLSAENARLALTDSLTGLPNRRYFFTQLSRLIADREQGREPFAAGVLDLDSFKPINDSFGHVVGDRLLAEIGRRLAGVSNDGLIIARLGGDEFGVLITRDVENARAIGERLCALLSRVCRIQDVTLSVGCTCGLAVFPDAGLTGHELFDRSDYALYHGKNAHRGGCTIFSIDHETHIRSERTIELALRGADIDRELDVHFQPIVDTFTRDVIGVEALARWHSPVLGHVPPIDFIASAERIGMVSTLTLNLLGKALSRSAGLPPDVGLSFNLSATDTASAETMARIIALVRGGPLDPSRLTLEITETAVMRDFERAIAFIRDVRALGVRVALDDFGTGYSSLSYLRQLPLDSVKVDRSFAEDLRNDQGRKIVTAISGLCRNLSLDCVIEGIEDEEQLLHARRLGYRFAQGYLFARPMPMPDLLDWIARERANPPFTAAPEVAPARAARLGSGG